MSDGLVFASAGPAGVHYARCEPCMCATHPYGEHPWAGPEDIEHAQNTGQPASAIEGRCACWCSHQPEPDLPDDFAKDQSLDVVPCPVCGESAACGYDNEGRALIHALDEDAS